MDEMMLWMLFVLGIGLLLFGLLRKPEIIKDSMLAFLLKAYFSTFFGVIVVEMHMLDYPVRILSQYFDTSILFEYLLYPVVCVFFYQTTLRSSFLGIVGQCTLYISVLTAIEVLFEKYTSLIHYNTWKWWYSFLTMFVLSFSVRMMMVWINKKQPLRK
ncbi:CBO0543 family protein [Anoxybacteroides tepidamans]|uniref:CBO0543 family protein n=1 Tax=Anoxybacteroides tepidamans TaxID=265948 RepID=UPI00047FAFEE|nr:CBO0543 family protein [Anoxybacillus tepidamans]